MSEPRDGIQEWDNPVPMPCREYRRTDSAIRDYYGGEPVCHGDATHVEIEGDDAVRFLCYDHARELLAEREA
jgi:hypothetical protein